MVTSSVAERTASRLSRFHAFAPILERGISLEVLKEHGVEAVEMFSAIWLRYPIALPDGRVRYRYKRIHGAGDKYFCDPHSEGMRDVLYGADSIVAGKRMILCEGEPDFWLLRTLRFPAATMLCGAGSASSLALKELAERKPLRVLIAYDNDEAGRRGRMKAARILERRGVSCDVVDLGSLGLAEGADICDLYRWVGRDRDRFLSALRHARRVPIPQEPLHQPSPRDRSRYADFNRAHDVVDLASQLTPLHRKGRVLVGRCPLGTHRDSTPSFTVYPDDGHWYCFGCSRRGDSYDLHKLLGGGEVL